MAGSTYFSRFALAVYFGLDMSHANLHVDDLGLSSSDEFVLMGKPALHRRLKEEFVDSDDGDEAHQAPLTQSDAQKELRDFASQHNDEVFECVSTLPVSSRVIFQLTLAAMLDTVVDDDAVVAKVEVDVPPAQLELSAAAGQQQEEESTPVNPNAHQAKAGLKDVADAKRAIAFQPQVHACLISDLLSVHSIIVTLAMLLVATTTTKTNSTAKLDRTTSRCWRPFARRSATSRHTLSLSLTPSRASRRRQALAKILIETSSSAKQDKISSIFIKI
jgi:hypothetical protein